MYARFTMFVFHMRFLEFAMQRFLLALAFALALSRPSFGQLQPDEVLVIAARGNRDSESLAKYYIRVRGLPPENLCLVDVPKEEVCPREMWRWGIRPEIQKWILEHDPQQKLKCLVTVWGVPLKIGPAAADNESRKYQRFLEAERTHRLQLILQVVEAFDKLAPDAAHANVNDGKPSAAESTPSQTKTVGATTPQPTASAKTPAAVQPTPTTELGGLQTKLETALQQAQTRINRLPDGESRTGQQKQLQQLATAAGGLNVILPALRQRLNTDASKVPEMQAEFDAIRGRLTSYMETKSLLEQMPLSIDHDVLVLAILERASGLIGSVEWLDQQLDVVRKNETSASFDSELSLVLWSDGYQLLRWQPNYLRPAFDNSQLRTFNRTLMVSRIDAPTLRLAKGLIDTAIDVEKKGLDGKVYIDARGLANPTGTGQQVGSYEDFDRSLLSTAKGIGDQTYLDVVLENTPKLFQAGQCPKAALYCGWYSLAKYVDAFDWQPGAVAYHLASSEASTLRDPASEVWCKKMIEDGVCATIGPVYEPYLVAFPRPDEFFALLIRGDHTLVECYYRTQPFNSWMMTLIGDPLYRPFKNRVPIRPAEATKAPTNQPPPKATSMRPMPCPTNFVFGEYLDGPNGQRVAQLSAEYAPERAWSAQSRETIYRFFPNSY